jgi:hypothetical protein
MDTYDPLIAPNPKAWLALDEAARLALVGAYHERNPADTAVPAIHNGMHVAVENQVAEGNALPVAAKLRQLMMHGLDRHEAVHAIATVLLEHMQRVATGRVSGPDPNKLYFSKLRRLTARSWYRDYGDLAS